MLTSAYRVARSAACMLLAFSAVGCGSDELCDADEIRSALVDGASTVVELGACTVELSGEIPAGVTLQGRGVDQTSLVVSGDRAGLDLSPGVTETKLSDLSISSTARVGVLARGAGAVTLERVRINAAIGIALGAEDATSIRLTDVTVTGPVNAGNASQFLGTVTSTQTGTYGIVLNRVTSANFSNVRANGFALTGVLAVSSNVTWQGGNASDNLGLGIHAEGGTMNLQSVEILRTLQGYRLQPAYGAAFTASVAVTTTDLRVANNEGLGLFQHTGTAAHTNLDGTGNNNAALWAQRVQSMDVSGTLASNKFANIVAVDAENVTVHDASMDSAIKTLRVWEETGAIEVGDGIQLVRTSRNVVLRDLTLNGNERVGILIETETAAAQLPTFSNVEVTVTSSSAFGAVARDAMTNLPPNAGWDTGVTRIGVSAAVDYAAASDRIRLRSVEAVGPCERPRATGVGQRGIAFLTGF